MIARHLALHLLVLATSSASNLGIVSPQEQRYLQFADDDFFGDDFNVDDTFGDTNDDSVPTKSPTKKPVALPNRSPTKKPVAAPNRPPTKAPVKPPTNAPRRSPTIPPVNAPTPAPVADSTIALWDDDFFGGDDSVHVDDIFLNDDEPPVAPTRSPVKVPTRPTKPTPRVPTPRPVAPVSAPRPTDDFLSGDDYSGPGDDNLAGFAPTRSPTRRPTKKPTQKPVVAAGACRKRNSRCGNKFGKCCVASGLACIHQRSSKGRLCLPCKTAGSRCTKSTDCCQGTQCVKVKHRPFKKCQRTRSV